MAQTITVGTGNYLTSATQIATWPRTFACWFNVPTTLTYYRLMNWGHSAGSAFWTLYAAGQLANDPVVFQESSIGTGSQSNGFTANTWHHAAGVATATNSRVAYLDGVAGTTNTQAAETTPDVFAFQVIRRSSPAASNGNCTVAHAAGWNVALNQGELDSLAAGFSPLCVRPQSIVFYYPLGAPKAGPTNYNNLFGGYNLSKTGTVTYTDGPPIIYPAPVQVGVAPVTAGLTVDQIIALQRDPNIPKITM